MHLEPIFDSLRQLLSLLFKECCKHISIQVGIEPVTRNEQSSIEICHDSNVSHIFEEFGLARLEVVLNADIDLLRQVINVNLLIVTFQVNNTRLHGNVGAFL